jgi:hypothetical protein
MKPSTSTMGKAVSTPPPYLPLHDSYFHPSSHTHSLCVWIFRTHHLLPSSQLLRSDLPTATVDLFSSHSYWEYTNLTVQEDVSTSRLQRHQAYEFWVELTVPESPTNENIGMFMVRVSLENSNHELLARCSRATSVKYTSAMLQKMNTAVYALPLVLGWVSQTQYIQLRCFDGFVESQMHPVRYVKVELSHPEVQVYSAQVRIHALLSGVRYIMYHWWLMGAVVGISQLMSAQTVFILFLWLYFRGTAIVKEEDRLSQSGSNRRRSVSFGDNVGDGDADGGGIGSGNGIGSMYRPSSLSEDDAKDYEDAHTMMSTSTSRVSLEEDKYITEDESGDTPAPVISGGEPLTMTSELRRRNNIPQR